MKSLFVLMVLFSASAFACPDLTGKYTCVYREQSEEWLVEQGLENGFVRFTFLDPARPSDRHDTVLADGIWHKAEPTASLKNRKVRTWCEGDRLKVEHRGRFYFMGEDSGPAKIEMELYKENGKFIQMQRANLGGIPLPKRIVCTPHP